MTRREQRQSGDKATQLVVVQPGGAARDVMDGFFDAEGKLTNQGTADFLKKFMQAFAAWIEKIRGA